MMGTPAFRPRPEAALREDQCRSLSIVIIARNEETRIASSIESAGKAASCKTQPDIVLVDSKSTDNTVAIARKYPIRIYTIGFQETPSPAAGRAVGQMVTNGTYIMFLDGDMMLNQRWLIRALDFLEDNEAFAAISGKLVDGNSSHDVAEVENASDDRREALTVAETRILRGSFLVRRSCLEKAGGVNPHVKGDEEAELSYRLESSGFKIGESEEWMAIHPKREHSALTETIRRRRSGYFDGQGHVLKMAFYSGRSYFIHHLWRLKRYILYDIWIVTFVMSSVSSLAWLNPLPLTLWCGITAAGVVAMGMRHGFKEVPVRVLSSVFVGWGIAKAVLSKLPEPGKHEISYMIVDDAPRKEPYIGH